jgi:hypothetical protein
MPNRHPRISQAVSHRPCGHDHGCFGNLTLSIVTDDFKWTCIHTDRARCGQQGYAIEIDTARNQLIARDIDWTNKNKPKACICGIGQQGCCRIRNDSRSPISAKEI